MAKENKTGRVSARVLALVLTLVLVFGSVVGGTVAWLIATPDPVVNTFTYGDIDITLEETDTHDGDSNPNTNEYKMMPGQEIPKDPKVTVKAGSENNWLFVKLEKSANFDDFMTYTIADGWTQLYDEQGNPVEGVYYRYQDAVDTDTVYSVLAGDKVVVASTVTKAQLNALDEDPTNTSYPTLTVRAYAVQYVGFEAEISEGASAATPEQVNAAALKAWNVATA